MSNYEKKNAPPNFTVREVPRTNPKYLRVIDKYYYEAGIGKPFRSKKKAWARYHESQSSKDVQTIIINDQVAQNITEGQKVKVEEFHREAWMNLVN